MEHVARLRSVMSKEGDHERGTYLMKTGYRPDPTVVQPSIGAICCHELRAGKTEVPRHISILPNHWPGRGGFLGDEYDAFKIGDPAQKIPDLASQVSSERDRQRLGNLDVVERAFARGRRGQVGATTRRQIVQNARKLMSSEQLQAFEVSRESEAVRNLYGGKPFGRGCLAARRLIEVGVRCVEVTLDGWDSRANKHEIQRKNLTVLDPAFSGLLRDLKEHGLLVRMVVLWPGEFGRTGDQPAGQGVRQGDPVGEERRPDGGDGPVQRADAVGGLLVDRPAQVLSDQWQADRAQQLVLGEA
jgi:hypothetical protein